MHVQTGATPLHTAAWLGLASVAAELVKRGASAVDSDEVCGFSSWLIASTAGHRTQTTDTVHCVVAARCVVLQHGRTAVDAAVASGHRDLVPVLLGEAPDSSIEAAVSRRSSTSLLLSERGMAESSRPSISDAARVPRSLRASLSALTVVDLRAELLVATSAWAVHQWIPGSLRAIVARCPSPQVCGLRVACCCWRRAV